MRLIAKCDDQLDISTFNGFENLFDKSILESYHVDAFENDMSFVNVKEDSIKRRDSVGAFKEYLHIIHEDLV